MYADICKYRGKRYILYNFPRPSDLDYIVFSVLGKPLIKNFSTIRVPEDYKLEIGNKNSEVSIPSDSINKIHSYLTYVSKIGELILNDN